VDALNSLEGELAGYYYSLAWMSDADRLCLEKDHFLFRKEHGCVQLLLLLLLLLLLCRCGGVLRGVVDCTASHGVGCCHGVTSLDSAVAWRGVCGARYFAYAGVYRDWAQGRGIFHNPSKTFLVWVNEEDQLRIISMENSGNIGAVFTRLLNGVAALDRKLPFHFDDQRGFIATCPSNLGTGMRASVHIQLPLASKDPRFKTICEELHLQPRGADGEHSPTEGSSLFDISPLKRLGLTEVDCAKALHAGAVRLIALEKELRAAASGSGSVSAPSLGCLKRRAPPQ
jgi:hypothetical protein